MKTKIFKNKLGKTAVGLLVFATIFALSFGGAIPMQKANAGALSNLAVSVASATPGATTTYTATFTPATTVPNTGGLVNIMSPQSFGKPGEEPENLIDFSGVTKSNVTINGIEPEDIFKGGSTLSLMLKTPPANSNLLAGSPVSVIIGNVKNPSKAGSYTLTVATSKSEQDKDPTYLDGDLTKGLYPTNAFVIGTPSVIGKIVDPNGNSVQYAHIVVYSASSGGAPNQYSGTSYETDSDGAGNFSLSEVPAGTYKMKIMMPWNSQYMAPSVSNFSVTSGATTNLGTLTATNPTKTLKVKVTKKDGTGVVAQVGANSRKGDTWKSITTGTDGTGTLMLSGGAWDVMVMPPQDQTTGQDIDVDWIYERKGPPVQISFTDDTTAETQSKDFTVINATSTIKGTLKNPDGKAFDKSAHVEFRSKEGIGNGCNTAWGTGKFSCKVVGGTYKMSGWIDAREYAFPSLDPISIKDNETKDLGSITLEKKSSHITGTVIDKSSGAPVSGFRLTAFMREGMGFAEAESGSDGTFDMLVSPGDWMITGGMEFKKREETSDYVYSGPPIDVSIKKDSTKSVGNVAVVKADAKIAVSVVDSKTGATLTDVFGFAFASSASAGGKKGKGFEGPGLGAPIQAGTATIKVPAGTYSVGVGMGPESGYMAEGSVSATVASGGTAQASVKLAPTDSTFLIQIVDNKGKPVSVNGEVFAENGKGAFTHAMIIGGKATLKVISGTWRIGYHLFDESGYISQPPNKSFKIGSGDAKTVKLKTVKANSTISGQVLDPDGKGLANAFVSVEKKGISGSKALRLGSKTENDGTYKISVPAGTYEVRAHAPSELGYLNPKVEKVTTTPVSPGSADFKLKKADAKITGTVFLGTTTQAAFVYAYSKDGSYAEDFAGADGVFSLNVEKGNTFYIGANFESGDAWYQAEEVEVAVSGNETVDLALKKMGTMPSAQTISFDASGTQVITLENGVKINIPAGALASSGTVTVNAEPQGRLAFQSDAQPIDIGYDLTALDSNGQEITENFNSNVTITIPYTVKQLERMGITEDDLVPSYWDETTSTWKKADNVTIDKRNNRVVITTNHFTKFANIAKKSKKRVDKVTPSSVKYDVGTRTATLTIDVKGINLSASGVKVKVGGKTANSVKIKDKNTLTAQLSYGGMKAGTYDVTVIYPEKTKVAKVAKSKKKGSRKVKVKYVTKTVNRSVTSLNAFTVMGEKPEISSFSPSIRKYTKNKKATLKLTVKGTNFTEDSKVSIGGVSAEKMTYKNSDYLIANFKVYKLDKGKQSVVVTNVDGQKDTADTKFTVKK